MAREEQEIRYPDYPLFKGLQKPLEFMGIQGSNEQLVFEHGVFHREVDYQELYRVVDFNESQTFMQQLFRLKTVSIYSGDRTTPRLDIIGVPMKEELVTTIRKRVETSKRRRSIYEITNR